MSFRIHEIDRTVRELQHPKSRAEEDELMPDVDLDESQLELFAQYVTALEGIGVNLQDERLRDTLNAYPDNMEAAIQAVARVCGYFGTETSGFSRSISRHELLGKNFVGGMKTSLK
ncbi:hypothetical protein B7486_23250 [cyanobacterium TDX16]|nr:hypothetical protein B7486_23250 [cyanobacterium TDX16]